MSQFCQSCGAKMEDDSQFCTSCGKPVATPATAPSPVAAQPPRTVAAPKGGGSKTLLFLGCGCLVLILFVLALGIGVWLGWEKIKGVADKAGVSVLAGGGLGDFAGVWVLESEKDDADADDIVIFTVEGSKLIGVSGEPNSGNRIELTLGANGKLTGTAAADGTSEAVEAELSADKQKLTVTIKPGTSDARTAVLVKGRWPGAGAAAPAAGANAANAGVNADVPGIEDIVDDIQADPSAAGVLLEDYTGNWVADQGEPGENNVMFFEVENGRLVGTGGPTGNFVMKLSLGDDNKLHGTFSDGQGNSIPITGELSRDKQTLLFMFKPPASEPWRATFSRVS